MSQDPKPIIYYRKKICEDLTKIQRQYDAMLRTAKKCSAEAVIRGGARDNIGRDTTIFPMISHGLLAAIFAEMIEEPKRSERYSKLVGKYLLPQCGLGLSKDYFNCDIGRTYKHFCSDTEGYFVDVLTQIGSRTYSGQPRISVYHDENGAPIALRKSTQESSALLLMDARMGKLCIPMGTFVDIDHEDSATISGRINSTDGYNGWILESYSLDNRLTIAPGRLSPWAFESKKDRKIFGVRRYSNLTVLDRDRAKKCSKNNLGSFLKVSTHILELLGIR